jgi:alpha-tubulin suppressor-like RCC1 family protein
VFATKAVRLTRNRSPGVIDGKGQWSIEDVAGRRTVRFPRVVAAADDCAITADGRVLCIADLSHNDHRVGEGILVTGVADAVQIAATEAHVCVRRKGGEVACSHGRAPFETVAGVTAIDLAVGKATTCAVTAEHAVACWNTESAHAEPGAPIAGLPKVSSIAIGEHHACARAVDSTVWCWGSNEYGQLGDSTTTAHARPAIVPGLVGVVQIAAGDEHTCALLDTGAIRCWGDARLGAAGSYAMFDVADPIAVQW